MLSHLLTTHLRTFYILTCIVVCIANYVLSTGLTRYWYLCPLGSKTQIPAAKAWSPLWWFSRGASSRSSFHFSSFFYYVTTLSNIDVCLKIILVKLLYFSCVYICGELLLSLPQCQSKIQINEIEIFLRFMKGWEWMSFGIKCVICLHYGLQLLMF